VGSAYPSGLALKPENSHSQLWGQGVPVVWSDGYHLTYALSGSPGYGKGQADYGFYACRSEADGAGFQAAP
jgi:hypothetical protein